MMFRLLTVFLITVFSFSSLSVEATNISIKSQFKSCCCKTGICRCQQHAGPKACPLQKNLQTRDIQESANKHFPLLMATGCGSNGEKSQLPNSFMQDFDIENAPFQFVLNQSTYLIESNPSFQFLFDRHFDPPPRIFSSSFPV